MNSELTHNLKTSLSSILPERQIMEVVKLSTRQSNDVYCILLDSLQPAIVLKLYHGNDARDRANAEVSALLSLASKPVSVPRLLSYGERLSSAFDAPYTLQSWIIGKSADVVLQKSGQDIHLAVGKLLARAARVLHSVKFPRYGSLCASRPQFSSWNDYLFAFLDAKLAECQRYGLVDSSFVVHYKRYIENRLKLIVPSLSGPVLVHSDLVPINVSLSVDDREKMTISIYDFERSMAANPYWEFVQMQRRFFLPFPEVARSFFDEYFEHGLIPSDFHEQLPIYELVEKVQFWSWAFLEPDLCDGVKQSIERSRTTIM